ncbi:MAG: hypothetical protein CML65_04485 [Rhodobacteraceae bacterium]|nr:hypothetical protein [Paracoccaceae bacterium]
MDLETEMLRLPRQMRLALHQMADQDDVSPGQFVRGLIGRELSRRSGARPLVRADEQLVAPLRARLADDLAAASGWTDLARRLREKGFDLRQAGGGLALHAHPGGQRLCKASELGFSYSRLMLPAPGRTPEAEEDDFEVIERD